MKKKRNRNNKIVTHIKLILEEVRVCIMNKEPAKKKLKENKCNLAFKMRIIK